MHLFKSIYKVPQMFKQCGSISTINRLFLSIIMQKLSLAAGFLANDVIVYRSEGRGFEANAPATIIREPRHNKAVLTVPWSVTRACAVWRLRRWTYFRLPTFIWLLIRLIAYSCRAVSPSVYAFTCTRKQTIMYPL